MIKHEFHLYDKNGKPEIVTTILTHRLSVRDRVTKAKLGLCGDNYHDLYEVDVVRWLQKDFCMVIISNL